MRIVSSDFDSRHQLSIASVDGSGHAADHGGNLRAFFVFAGGVFYYHAYAFNSYYVGGIPPLALAHINFGVIDAKGFDLNQDKSLFWGRRGIFREDQVFGAAATVTPGKDRLYFRSR